MAVMTDLERYQFITGNPTFWDRVYIAVLDVADDIMFEDAGATNHANRVIWATEARQDPRAKVNEMKNRIAQHQHVKEKGDAITYKMSAKGAWDGLVDVVASFINEFAKG